MRLQRIELFTLELMLRQPIGTAAGIHHARPLLLVRVVTDEGDGWGECAALESGTSVDPPLADVTTAMVSTVVPRLFTATTTRKGHLPAAWQIARLFGSRPVDVMAGATLEMALLDLEIKVDDVSLVSRLSEGLTEPRTTSRASGAGLVIGTMVGIPDQRDLGTICALVDRQVAEGVGRVRVKIEPGWDVVPLTTLRHHYPGLMLLADANGSYRRGSGEIDDVSRLAALDDLGLTCIEQPLPPADLAALAQISSLLATPIGLDESLSSPQRVTDAIRIGAGSVACLKPGRLGGLLAARRAAAEWSAAGKSAFVGGFFESGLGRSANLGLGHCAGFNLPGDLASPATYLEAEPFGYPAVTAGRVAAPDGPGIAGSPDPSVLDRLTATKRVFDFSP